MGRRSRSSVGATMVPVMFDLIVMVDWSASSRPIRGPDSIWIATVEVETGETSLHNPATRRSAEALLRQLLHEAAGRRVLVGVDVPFGYPAGFAACLRAIDALPVVGGAGAPSGGGVAGTLPPWRRAWQAITSGLDDAADNSNDRFELAARFNALVGEGPGPFWGCPASKASVHLATHKVHRFPVAGPAGPIQEYRLTERRSRRSGRYPLSVWQTAYTGGVGSQALTAIPVLERLLTDPPLDGRAEVWPFTTGLVPDPTRGRAGAIVLAEIWPSGFDLDLGRHRVKDAAQVIGMAERMMLLDAEGSLSALFRPDLDEAERTVVVAEEGWILGVP